MGDASDVGCDVFLGGVFVLVRKQRFDSLAGSSAEPGMPGVKVGH